MGDGQCPRSLPATERISFQLIWGPRANSEAAVCKPTIEAPPLPNPYLKKRPVENHQGAGSREPEERRTRPPESLTKCVMHHISLGTYTSPSLLKIGSLPYKIAPGLFLVKPSSRKTAIPKMTARGLPINSQTCEMKKVVTPRRPEGNRSESPWQPG